MPTFLRTPDDWPRVLLEHVDTAAPAAAPAGTAVTWDADAALAEAQAKGAFDGLHRAIRDLGGTGTIAAVAASGLRGRGGAGFPTGEKWRAAAGRRGPRVAIANGYGADPASGTDHALLMADPWAVIEGVLIAAYAIGASEAIVAVRGEQTELVDRLEAAVAATYAAGLAGDDIDRGDWSVELSVRPVQGAYMLGEETVLIKALEGKRGQPEQRPPHPSEDGLFGRPTVVNNVQTLAAVPWIVRNGAAAYSAIGTKGSPGTILVQVRGPQGEGIAEVPTGTPLRQLIDLAGGLAGGHPLKALLVGGPSGGLLPAELLDTPYEFDALRAVGAHVGSGSVVIADDRACVVDLARILTRFCADEACGKTIPCRIGLRRMSEIADRIATGRPRASDVTLLEDLAHDVTASGLCDHERLATLSLSAGMRYFRSELDDHLLRSSCPAGVCQPLAVAAAAAT
jgi:NADH-quinone oxidoreductase subunit F